MQAVFVFGFLIMVLCTYTALSVNDKNHKSVEVIVQDKEIPVAAADIVREKPLQPPLNVQNPIKTLNSVKDKPPDSIQQDKNSNGEKISMRMILFCF